MGDTSTSRIEMSGITKSFPGVKALKNIDLCIFPGEVHALLGENGAGKSTLIKVMTGALSSDEGTIRLDGQEIELNSTVDAQKLGISTVYQEVNLIPAMSVAKNMTLQHQPTRFGFISWRKARKLARKRLKQLSLDIDLERPVGSYSIAIQQLVAIARALEDKTKVLVLDEPTASLDAGETKVLFNVIRELKSRGIAIVFITHFLDQVYEISDRITVLRNGEFIGTSLAKDLPRLELIKQMIGRELEQVERHSKEKTSTNIGDPVVVAEGLGCKRVIEPFDIIIRQGEVVGLAGLLGSGRTETAKLIFGALHADSGTLTMSGTKVSNNSPRKSLSRNIAFCPEDRKEEGLVGELTIRENIILSLQAKKGWLNQLSYDEQKRLAEGMIDALAIATPDMEKPVNQLSGGNQQKVVLARALVSDPKLLILDEPTRGIDVGAHAEIVTLIRRLCSEGMALLVASSELDEIVAVSDRVAVLRDHNQIGEIAGDDVTREKIIGMIAGE